MGEGFPLWSMSFMAAEGWEPLRDWISLSLFPSVSVLPDSTLSPFLTFPEIRNSDWAEILIQFLSGYWLSCGEGRAPTALRSGHEGPGCAPHPRGPLGHRLALIPLPKIHIYSKKNLRKFLSRLDYVWYEFSAKQKAFNKEELELGTGSIC